MKIYQLNITDQIKKECKRKLLKNIKIFFLKKKKGNNNMVVNVTKNLSGYEKNKKKHRMRKSTLS